MVQNEDKYYIARSLNGHPDDFRHLVRRYQNVLMAQLIGQLGNREKAEEVAQETFVRSYFNLSKLKNRDAFCPWLLGISNLVAKEQYKKEKRRQEAVKSLEKVSTTQTRRYDYPLAKTIARLPNTYRQLILLRYYGDLSCKEISRQYNIPLGTVTKSLSRAYALLRDMLRQQDCEVQP